MGWEDIKGRSSGEIVFRPAANMSRSESFYGQFFANALKIQCAICRFKGMRRCVHVIAKCVKIALLVSSGSSRRVRPYIRSAHELRVHTRFLTFDDYLTSLNGDSFLTYTRTTVEEFENILARLAPRIAHMARHRAPISPRHRLAILLHYLGHGMSFTCLAQHTRTGKTTVAEIVYEVCAALIQEFSDDVLALPNRQTWAESARGFAQRGYPRGVAALDGKHFRVASPQKSGSSYYNFKGYFSVVLLALVSSSGTFLMVDCGGKGRVSDSGLFRSSAMKTFLDAEFDSFPEPAPLAGHGVVNYHILCDGGFAQTVHMQRPFTQAEAGTSQKLLHFNKCFSSARQIVGRAFGVLSSRFRLFYRPMVGTPLHLKQQIVAAVILHNILLRSVGLDEAVSRFPPSAPTTNDGNFQSQSSVSEAKRQRMRLVNYFAERDNVIDR